LCDLSALDHGWSFALNDSHRTTYGTASADANADANADAGK
jgi:hypothetical protein